MKQEAIIPGINEAEMRAQERTKPIATLYDKASTILSSLPEYIEALHKSFMAGETNNGVTFDRGKYKYVVTASDKKYPWDLIGEKKLKVFRRTRDKNDSGQQIEMSLKYRMKDSEDSQNDDGSEPDFTEMKPHFADIYLDSNPQDMDTPPKKNTQLVIVTAYKILDELSQGL